MNLHLAHSGSIPLYLGNGNQKLQVGNCRCVLWMQPMQERKLETPSALRPILKKQSLGPTSKVWLTVCRHIQMYVLNKKKKQYIGRIFGFLAFIWLTDHLLDIIKLG